MVEISMVVPTYNESENIENLLRAVSKTLEGYDYEIIVVDDNSPDGTAGIIQEYAAGVDRIRLLVRSGKLGLGSAILDGFRMAKGNYFLMLDADLSHRPEDIKRLIDNRKGADIVIGSRYIKGGKIIGWPLKRRIISRSAVVLAKNLFRLKVKDPVSGFALYKKEIFERQSRKLDPIGYKLLLEILVKSQELTVTEIPITFLERKNGQSKLNTDEIINFIKLCWRLRI
ncbi:MAG: polyprenol monophosphomannose synthase [Candidatus Methanoperedens sp.]|nr:polyprenol monophosphomannose synthase [Candidatus Methanoperedens sp.]